MAYSILKSPSVFLSIEEQRRLKGKDGGKIDSLLIEHIQEKQRRELNMIESCKETAKTKNQSIGARTLNRDAPARRSLNKAPGSPFVSYNTQAKIVLELMS